MDSILSSYSGSISFCDFFWNRLIINPRIIEIGKVRKSMMIMNIKVFIFYYRLTTEIRDFERSEEIPLQLMVMYLILILSSNTLCILSFYKNNLYYEILMAPDFLKLLTTTFFVFTATVTWTTLIASNFFFYSADRFLRWATACITASTFFLCLIHSVPLNFWISRLIICTIRSIYK